MYALSLPWWTRGCVLVVPSNVAVVKQQNVYAVLSGRGWSRRVNSHVLLLSDKSNFDIGS